MSTDRVEDEEYATATTPSGTNTDIIWSGTAGDQLTGKTIINEEDETETAADLFAWVIKEVLKSPWCNIWEDQRHEWVNVGFSSIKLVCKHCNREHE